MNSNGRHAISSSGLRYEVDSTTLLEEVDLEAAGGQFVGLIGPNGAGKTTLLRTIAGVIGMSGGEVILEGADLASLSARQVAERLALVPQIAPYTHGFNVMELVLMGRYPHLGRFQIEGKQDARVVQDAMRQSETEQFADRTLETLSGGERQRVFIARALAQQPRILLMDEPTANLDVLHQFKVMDIVRGLVDGGLTAVAAIHDLNMAARYCDRLVVMSSGRVVAQGEPRDVLTRETIRAAFGIESELREDAATGCLAVSMIGPAQARPLNGRQSVTAVPSMQG